MPHYQIPVIDALHAGLNVHVIRLPLRPSQNQLDDRSGLCGLRTCHPADSDPRQFVDLSTVHGPHVADTLQVPTDLIILIKRRRHQLGLQWLLRSRRPLFLARCTSTPRTFC